MFAAPFFTITANRAKPTAAPPTVTAAPIEHKRRDRSARLPLGSIFDRFCRLMRSWKAKLAIGAVVIALNVATLFLPGDGHELAPRLCNGQSPAPHAPLLPQFLSLLSVHKSY